VPCRPDARCGFTSRWLGVAGAISPDARYGHPALRSLDAGLAFAILSSLGQQRRLDWHRPPLANLIPRAGYAIKAPRREPGGRRAVGWGSPRAGSGRARAVSPGRSLRASRPLLARCWLAFGIPAFASPATPAPRHGPTPREPLFRVRAIEAPRREPGGRRAVGLFPSPESRAPVHHQPAQSAVTANQLPVSTPRETAGR